MMRFSEAVRTCLHKYVDFEGRATRAEYWWFCLFTNLVSLAGQIPMIYGYVLLLRNGASEDEILEVFDMNGFVWLAAGFVLVGLVGLGLLLPSLAVTVRRLHDTNRSGWWYFIGFLPYVGVLILLVFMLLPSRDDNQYGPYPDVDTAGEAAATDAPAE